MEKRISGHTGLLALIGSPVGHSGSPAMYNYSFEKLGLDYAYVAFDIKIEEVKDAIRKIGEMREDLTFGIDGAVIKIDDLKFREILGTTVKTPRWAIAYKYPPEQKETTLIKMLSM